MIITIRLISSIIISILLLSIKSVDITLSSLMEDKEESTYSISNNVLSLNSNTDYKISGSCSECKIEVDKGVSASITLNSVNIDNSKTGPFVIKKGSTVNLILEGESTITDKETDESSSDFEGAGIKFKSSSSLTISGDGKLNVIGNIKNGIKGASGSNLIINGGNLDIKAVNNALAADGSLTINDGTFIISTSEGDGIKSDPDYGDEDSKGIVTINGGTFNINSYSDGIQAKTKLTITGGNFNIKTYTNGASSSNFDKDNESAKGLKCSYNETADIVLNITGGSFILNTADDSIHSDGNVTITGGNFEISSGDDGVHADQYLILGKENADNSLIKMNILKSLEGIEGSYIYIYSGTYNVIASDDGINSAGDTEEECGFGGNNGGRDPFWGKRENKKRNLKNRKLAECFSFHMYIYGGEIFVNAEADGLDANGNIEISGGNITVWGAKSGSDGDPIDMDGTLTIKGGTIFAGGNQGMTQIDRQAKNSQQYISQSGSYSPSQTIYILNGDTTIRQLTIPKNIRYMYYTSPNVVSSTYKFSTSSGSKSGTDSDPSSSEENITKFINFSSNFKINTLFLFVFALLI